MRTTTIPRFLGSAALGAALLLALAGCGDPLTAAEVDAPAPDAEVLEVRRGALQPRMLLSGELDAEEAVYLNVPDVDIWPVSIRWIIEDGEAVQAGDVVVEFDDTQLLSTYEDLLTQAYEAEAALDEEQASQAGELAKARFEHEKMKAEAEKARLEAEIPESIQAERDFQSKQLALRRAELRLAQQEQVLASLEASSASMLGVKRIALEKATHEAEKAEDSIREMTVTAPRDGLVIVGENWRENRVWKPGDSAFPGMALARLPDLDTLYVRAQLFDVDDGRLRAGQKARARLDAFPDKIYEGVVREVGEVAEQRSRLSQRRFFKVVVDLEEFDPERMLPGMSVQLVIEEEAVEALLVPRQSIDWSAEKPRVQLADGSWATPALGACDAFACAVEGLDEGTRLAAVPRTRSGEDAAAEEGR